MGVNMMQFIRKIRFFYLVHLKWRKYKFGANPYIGRFVYMYAKHKITIGDNFYIGKFSQIECDATIGDNVILANRVAFIGRYDHHYQQLGTPTRLASSIRDNDYNWKGLTQSIEIENDVWIGYGSIILSGVKIGCGSIVAAGSLVSKDVEPYSIYAGVPAKKIRNRFENENDLNTHIKLYNSKNSTKK